MFTDDPDQTTFPVACHAQLAVEPNGNGVDSPVGVTFTSQLGLKAQTFSLSSIGSTSSLTLVSADPLTTVTSSPTPTDISLSVGSGITSTALLGPVPIRNNTPIRNSTAPFEEGYVSNGAKAGIGLGSAAIVAGVFGVLMWSFLWRRRIATTEPQAEKDSEKEDPVFLRYGKHELKDGANRRYELEGGRPRVYELVEESNGLYELP